MLLPVDVEKLRLRLWVWHADPAGEFNHTSTLLYERSVDGGISWSPGKVPLGAFYEIMQEQHWEVDQISLIENKNGPEGWRGYYNVTFKSTWVAPDEPLWLEECESPMAYLRVYGVDHISIPGLGEVKPHTMIDPIDRGVTWTAAG